LPRAEPRVAVLAELVVEGRQLGGPVDIEPVGIVLLEVVDRVGLREAEDLEPRRVLLRGWRLPPPRAGGARGGAARETRSKDVLESHGMCARSQARTRRLASSKSRM